MVTAFAKADGFPHTNRIIFCDNFFTNYHLVSSLKDEHGVYVCGTTRPHYKGWPASMKDKAKKELGA